MNNSNQALNIVLLPPIDVAKEAMRLSRLINERYQTEFILDGKNKYPHLTLYQIEIPGVNLKKTLKAVYYLFQKRPRIISKITGIRNYQTFISFEFNKTAELYKLHRKIVNGLEKFREGIKVSVALKGFKKFTASQKSDLEKYGSLGVMENFWPHITLTRLKSENDINAVRRLLTFKEFGPIIFEKAAVGKLSDHGTVTRIIEEYRLN